MIKVVIFSTSSFAKQMRYYFDSLVDYHVIGFVLDREYITEPSFEGLPVFSTEQLLNMSANDKVQCFVALGYKNMRLRAEKFSQLKNAGIQFANYISPAATCQVELDEIGDNVIVLANATIEPFVSIGDNVFIWSGTTICHDTVISEHCFIAAGSTIGGHCKLGKNCFLGFNSVVSNNVSLSDETLLGANSFLSKNTESRSFYAGSPAVRKIDVSLANGIKIE